MWKPDSQGQIFQEVWFDTDLKEVFGIEISSDLLEQHPSHFCHPCKNIIYFSKKALNEGREYNPDKTINIWNKHTDTGCAVCDSAGRPKKAHKAGRPAKKSAHSTILHINSISYTDYNNIIVANLHSDFECPLCLGLLNQPIELSTCQRYICAQCCCQWLRMSKSLSCPCCYSDNMGDVGSIRKPPSIVMSFLETLPVTCKLCSMNMQLKDHDSHLSTKCTQHSDQPDHTLFGRS